jgi:FkbM family methyltransferase
MTTAPLKKSILSRLKRRFILELETLMEPTVDVEIEEVRIQADQRISKWVRQALRHGDYESLEIRLLREKLTENDVVMEVGAGIGFISTYCAKQIGSERIFTYEANPQMEQHIRDVYRINGISPTLEICLIGEKDGEQTFYIDENFVASSAVQNNRNAKGIMVPVRSFNREVERLKPTLLILDVEGYEYEFCQYATFGGIQKILIELHERILGRDKSEAVKAHLTGAGFTVTEEISSEEAAVLFLEKA